MVSLGKRLKRFIYNKRISSHLNQARTLRHANQYEQALDRLQKAEKLSRTSIQIMKEYFWLYIRQGNETVAIDLLEKVIHIQIEQQALNLNDLFTLHDLNVKHRCYEDALKHLDSALKNQKMAPDQIIKVLYKFYLLKNNCLLT